MVNILILKDILKVNGDIKLNESQKAELNVNYLYVCLIIEFIVIVNIGFLYLRAYLRHSIN